MDGYKVETSSHLKDLDTRPRKWVPECSLENRPQLHDIGPWSGPGCWVGGPQSESPVLCKEPHLFRGPAPPPWRPEAAGRFARARLQESRSVGPGTEMMCPSGAQDAVQKETVPNVPGWRPVLPGATSLWCPMPSAEKEPRSQQGQCSKLTWSFLAGTGCASSRHQGHRWFGTGWRHPCSGGSGMC